LFTIGDVDVIGYNKWITFSVGRASVIPLHCTVDQR
jgi:hypothetical protein